MKVAALLACLAALPAAAVNHEQTVAPLPLGRFTVACSNVEHDLARLAQQGGTPVDYWEGNEVNGRRAYLADILAHPSTAFVFNPRVPDDSRLYPSRNDQTLPFVAIICHPTPRANPDPDYVLPGSGGTVPHMQPAGQAPKLLGNIEYFETLGIFLSPPPPAGPVRLPLVVYSHGLGGSPVGSGYLEVMTQLAAQGFVVAAVFHADARISSVRIEDLNDLAYALLRFERIVEVQALRPFALKAMTDALLANAGYAPSIDTSRIGAFGASMGGEAVAHLLGARITRTLGGSCGDTVTDPRIRAAVGYVPYSGQSFLPAFCDDQQGADTVNRPYLGIAGTADTTAPIGMTEQAINRMGSSRYLVELEGGEHELRPQDAGDVLTWTVTFLNAYLDNRTADPQAMARLIRMGRVSGGRPDNVRVDVHVPTAFESDESPVVEFYNPQLDHFFVAAGRGEIDGILAGAAGPGWELTRESFKVWPAPPVTSFPVAPVCRFYGLPAGGPNSHFFTASSEECAIVRRPGSGWFYEGTGFYIRPVGTPRVCPDGYLSVNRAYNDRASRNDSNHRFTTSDSTLREMGRKGWIMEGTVMCARP